MIDKTVLTCYNAANSGKEEISPMDFVGYESILNFNHMMCLMCMQSCMCTICDARIQPDLSR